MNEASTFKDGEADPSVQTETPQTKKLGSEMLGDANQWYDQLNGDIKTTFDTYHLPFVVRNAENTAGNYDYQALSLNATHPSTGESEYNLHSLYGHMMAWRTHDYLT